MSIRSTDTIIEFLASLPFLEGCPRKELATIDRCTTLVRVAAGTTLCSHGAAGQEAFIIVSGEAEVIIDGVLVAHLAAGSVVGEMALLEKAPRSATVTASTPMALLVMSSRDFFAILEYAPTMSQGLLATLAARLRAADSCALAS